MPARAGRYTAPAYPRIHVILAVRPATPPHRPQVKRRKCAVPAEVVRTLTVLRFREVTRPGQDEDEEANGRKRHKGEHRSIPSPLNVVRRSSRLPLGHGAGVQDSSSM